MSLGKVSCDFVKPEINSIKNVDYVYIIEYIYILGVDVLDETNISGCLHFSMQNIEWHVTAPLGGVSSTSANNVLCLSTIV